MPASQRILSVYQSASAAHSPQNLQNAIMMNGSGEGFALGAGRSAAVNVPVRRRRQATALKLAGFHALPDSLRDNEYITKYYRVNYNAKQTFRSLFGLHNETGNIWTHFLGAPNLLNSTLTLCNYKK